MAISWAIITATTSRPMSERNSPMSSSVLSTTAVDDSVTMNASSRICAIGQPMKPAKCAHHQQGTKRLTQHRQYGGFEVEDKGPQRDFHTDHKQQQQHAQLRHQAGSMQLAEQSPAPSGPAPRRPGYSPQSAAA